MRRRPEQTEPFRIPIVQVRREWAGSERGAALILVLALSTIALVIMTTVLYMVMVGSRLSGSEKRYRTACEAALGSVEVIKTIIQAQKVQPVSGITMAFQPSFGNVLIPGNKAISVTIDPEDPNTYDLTVDLGSPPYRVYIKMAEKRQGNTQSGYKLVRVKTGVVPSDAATVPWKGTYYTFNILSQRPPENVGVGGGGVGGGGVGGGGVGGGGGGSGVDQTALINERCRMDLVHVF